MDWKVRVVCEKCNNTWMSDIEHNHAKPVLTPLVTGQMNIPNRCRSETTRRRDQLDIELGRDASSALNQLSENVNGADRSMERSSSFRLLSDSNLTNCS